MPNDVVSETGPTTRRIPRQQRSRERMDRILDCARELIAARGSDPITMSEIAKSSGMSIGALYRYFPDKTAIVHMLAERYRAISRTCIEDALSGVADSRSLTATFAELIDQYYAMVQDDPAMRDIWSGTQADKHLMREQLADSRANARLLAQVIARILGVGEPDRFEALALLLWELGEATMRLALTCPPEEAEELLVIYKQMACRRLAELAGAEGDFGRSAP